MDKRQIDKIAIEIMNILKRSNCEYQDAVNILGVVNAKAHNTLVAKDTKKRGGERWIFQY